MEVASRAIELIEAPENTASPDELAATFASLGPVTAEEMIGSWSGGAFETESFAAKQLVAVRWHGKRFESTEDVHPMICLGEDDQPYSYSELGMARLREVSFDGVVSAAMVYDTQPIIDVFRRIDERRVMGLMDVKGMPPSFYFHLVRD